VAGPGDAVEFLFAGKDLRFPHIQEKDLSQARLHVFLVGEEIPPEFRRERLRHGPPGYGGQLLLSPDPGIDASVEKRHVRDPRILEGARHPCALVAFHGRRDAARDDHEGVQADAGLTDHFLQVVHLRDLRVELPPLEGPGTEKRADGIRNVAVLVLLHLSHVQNDQPGVVHVGCEPVGRYNRCNQKEDQRHGSEKK
jgi:hypothetical protein